MSKPDIADTKPMAVELKAGETVWWCSCGRSRKQPFCDGSHQGTDFEPVGFTAEKDGKVFFCLCKRSANPPLCDGSHNRISREDLEARKGTKEVWYRVADVDELHDGEVRAVQAGTQSIALTCHRGEIGALDNACPHQGGAFGGRQYRVQRGRRRLRAPLPLAWMGFPPLDRQIARKARRWRADLPRRTA